MKLICFFVGDKKNHNDDFPTAEKSAHITINRIHFEKKIWRNFTKNETRVHKKNSVTNAVQHISTEMQMQ